MINAKNAIAAALCAFTSMTASATAQPTTHVVAQASPHPVSTRSAAPFDVANDRAAIEKLFSMDTAEADDLAENLDVMDESLIINTLPVICYPAADGNGVDECKGLVQLRVLDGPDDQSNVAHDCSLAWTLVGANGAQELLEFSATLEVPLLNGQGDTTVEIIQKVQNTESPVYGVSKIEVSCEEVN